MHTLDQPGVRLATWRLSLCAPHGRFERTRIVVVGDDAAYAHGPLFVLTQVVVGRDTGQLRMI
jgi:hypothetical protein